MAGEKPIEFRIEGQPVGKARAGRRNCGTFIRSYDTQLKEKKVFLAQLLGQLPRGWEPLDDAVYILMDFWLSRPVSHWRKGRNSHILRSGVQKFAKSKPDLDNLMKFALDCMNEVVFVDDKLVVKVRAEKKYTREPQGWTTIKVFPASCQEEYYDSIL